MKTQTPPITQALSIIGKSTAITLVDDKSNINTIAIKSDIADKEICNTFIIVKGSLLTGTALGVDDGYLAQ